MKIQDKTTVYKGSTDTLQEFFAQVNFFYLYPLT